MATPSWIDKNLFETSLKKYFLDDGIKIVLFSLKLAASAGENYTTYVYRVKLTYTRSNSLKEEKLSLILKCMREGLMEGLVQELNMFTKEVDMFLTVLPEMNKVYGSNVLAANCISASLTPVPCLILQDMCASGFKVHERQCGVDLQHTLVLLEKMAIFHASSYVALDKNPSMLEKMYQTGLYPKKDAIVAWIKQGFEMITQLTVTSKEFSAYHDKMKTVLESDYIERALASWRRNEGEFSVLNHGDSWVNNMMFSYDEKGCVKDCRYLDFQLAIYTSPAVDLHYFVSTSLANDVIQDIDHLLDFYYIRLLLNLNKLKCKLKEVPSLKDFKADFRRRSFYGLTAMGTVLPLVRADSRADACFEELLSPESSENGFRHHCYNNNAFKGALLRLLPIYDKLGVFS